MAEKAQAKFTQRVAEKRQVGEVFDVDAAEDAAEVHLGAEGVLDSLDCCFENRHQNMSTLMLLWVESHVCNMSHDLSISFVVEIWALEPLLLQASLEQECLEPVDLWRLRVICLARRCVQFLRIEPPLPFQVVPLHVWWLISCSRSDTPRRWLP